MQITFVVDIVGGKLLNTPAISFITQIHTKVKKINDGDLFVAKNKNDLNDAISNGAFAILFDFDTDILDNEIAWIKVDDISKAQVKILRFALSDKQTKSFYCDDISFELLKLFSSPKDDLIFLTNNISRDFEKLKNTNNKIIFGSDKNYIKDILPASKKFTISKNKIKNLIQSSLFHTTFSFKDIFYKKIQIPNIYIDNFLAVEKFYNGLKKILDYNKLKKFQYFNPIFIDKYFQIVDFGSSDKFILANKNKKLIKKDIEFLNKNYNYAKLVIINRFKNDTELFQKIKLLNFNALYIKGKSAFEIKKLLQAYQNPPKQFRF
jgi:ferrochelatase